MKLAKKLLACLMVLAIAVSCAAIAFAQSGTPGIKLAYDEDEDCLSLNFIDAVGLKSWDLAISYETSAFDGMDYSEAGEDAEKVGNTKDNTIDTSAVNDDGIGTILVGGYFKESLWTAEEFIANAKKGKDASVNAENFEAYLFYMLEKDGLDLTTTATTIKVEGTFDMGEDGKKDVSDTLVIGKTAAEPTTAADVPTTTADVPTTTADVPTTTADVPTTTADVPTTGTPIVPTTGAPIVRPTDPTNIVVRPTGNNGKPGRPINDKGCSELPGPCHDKHIKTGDSAVLAAAAGVILLAGAAFVVSKKRK